MKHFFIFLFSLSWLLVSGQDQVILKSDHIPGNDTVWIFTPSDYDTSLKYPAVYLLHGWSGSYRSWSRLADLSEYADRYCCVIICPDGFYDSYYLESPVFSDWHYESFFVDELYPEMLTRYAIDSSRIVISGLSMGGEGAMYLFLRNPGLFLSAGSTSGVMDLSNSSNRDAALSRLLGEYATHKTIFAEHSPVNLLVNISNTDKQILFDCGSEDYLYVCNNAFRKKCDELHIPATYISQPGSHNSDYWKKSIRCHFEFFRSLW